MNAQDPIEVIGYAGPRLLGSRIWTSPAICMFVVGVILSSLYEVGSIANAVVAYREMALPPTPPVPGVLSSRFVQSPQSLFYGSLVNAGIGGLVFVGSAVSLMGWRRGRFLIWTGAAMMVMQTGIQFAQTQWPMLSSGSSWQIAANAAWEAANFATWQLYPVLTFFLIRPRTPEITNR
jgi:hypothetical protein